MKKLMWIMAVGGMLVAASGCRLCDWWRRGAPARAVTMPSPVFVDPCPPAAAPCDPCAPNPSTCAPVSPMVVPPGPETFVTPPR